MNNTTATEDYRPGAVGRPAQGSGLLLKRVEMQHAAPSRSAQSPRPVVFSNPLDLK